MTGDLAGNQIIIEVLYLIASVLFILSLKWMRLKAKRACCWRSAARYCTTASWTTG